MAEKKQENGYAGKVKTASSQKIEAPNLNRGKTASSTVKKGNDLRTGK